MDRAGERRALHHIVLRLVERIVSSVHSSRNDKSRSARTSADRLERLDDEHKLKCGRGFQAARAGQKLTRTLDPFERSMSPSRIPGVRDRLQEA